MVAKTAFVTGGSDRIGKGIALQLARLGYNILIHYNSSKERAAQTQQEVEALGVVCETVQLNFGVRQDWAAFFEQISERFDIEILVNNASDFSPSNFATPSDDLLFHHFHINFVSAYGLTKAFSQQKNKGLIINLLDTKVTQNDTQHLDYILSKKTLHEFTKISALELAPNFRVNGIAPGLVLPPKEEGLDYLWKKAKDIPLQIIGDLAQIQNAVVFLVSNQFITGQIIYVNGGEHL